MNVSFGECVVEGIEEFFKHILEYILIAALGYGLVRSFNPMLNVLLEQDSFTILHIYLYFIIMFLISSSIVYYLVQKIAINFILQFEENRKNHKTVKILKRKLFKQIVVQNLGKYLGNMFLLVILLFMIILSRELCLAFVKVYGLSDHFLVELFLNLIFGSIGVSLFFVYVIAALKVKKDIWTFKIAKKFSNKAFSVTLQFFAFIILNVFLVNLVFQKFKAQGSYMIILGNKVNSLMIEVPVMILISSLLLLYIIIHVIFTININKVHFKDHQWLIDAEFDYTNKW